MNILYLPFIPWSLDATELWALCTAQWQQHSTMEHYELLAGDYGDPITGDFTTKLPALC